MDSLKIITKHISNFTSGFNPSITFVVAYSGGWDSSVVLKLLSQFKQQGQSIHAVTFKTELAPTTLDDFDISILPQSLNVEFDVVPLRLMELDAVKFNSHTRCYECKKHLFNTLLDFANERYTDFVLIDGTNHEDTFHHRPGLQALKELSIVSPLIDCKLSKSEIKSIGLALELADRKKSTGACLATRFEYDTKLESDYIKRVDKTELWLKQNGFFSPRVRIHNHLVRIEVLPEDIEKLIKVRKNLLTLPFLKPFKHITIDLKGYEIGTMDK
jgi:uncharacterized protein